MNGKNSHTDVDLNSSQHVGQKRTLRSIVQLVAKKPRLNPKKQSNIPVASSTPRKTRGKTNKDAALTKFPPVSSTDKRRGRKAQLPLAALTAVKLRRKAENEAAISQPPIASDLQKTSGKAKRAPTRQLQNRSVLARIPTVTVRAPIPTVTAKAPIPPNWLDNYEDTIMSLNYYKKYNIIPSSAEYATITKMLHPVQIKGIERIVNPHLWKRFVNTRREMLRSKTDDFNLLSKLDLEERDVMRSTHLVLNYTKDPLLVPYSDNMALLFHCTKNKTNLDNILSEGLDERLSRDSGNLLGKGIYFSDDPRKSLRYDKKGSRSILIFAVLLGDCISVDIFEHKKELVREPAKMQQQKRNLNDKFFDSIVARPAGHNEYVIYNRYQCCPLYEIKYDPVYGLASMNNFNYATESLPPIAWIPDGSKCHMPIQKMYTKWPFFAADLFEKMGAPPPRDENDELPDAGNYTQNTSIDAKFITFNNYMDQFITFNNYMDAMDQFITFNNYMMDAMDYLLDQKVDLDSMVESNQLRNQYSTLAEATPIFTNSSSAKNVSPPSSATQTTTTSSSSIPLCSISGTANVIDLTDEAIEMEISGTTNVIGLTVEAIEMEDCLICYNDYESFAKSPRLWKELKCSHKLCQSCYSNILRTRTTMSGAQHTFVKCPFCQATTGTEVGTCPDVQMKVKIIKDSCESYEPTTSIRIKYFSDSNYKLNRTAYLPNNAEGKAVLQLLKIAWDRRLCFTVGTSVTTGRQNVIVWSIHHKTSLRGGVSSYGYPDPGYMDRVKWELKAFGIE